jgi:hypothetical protein
MVGFAVGNAVLVGERVGNCVRAVGNKVGVFVETNDKSLLIGASAVADERAPASFEIALTSKFC